MVTLIDRKTKVSVWAFLYMLVLLFYAGSASSFARSIGNITTLGNALILGLTVLVFIQKKIRIDRSLLVVSSVFLAFAAITSFQNRMINPMWMIQWLVSIFITYTTVKYYKKDFFIVFETAMFWMALISLPFWICELMFQDSFREFVRSISFLQSYSEEVNNANIIFYTVQDSVYTDNGFSLLFRNPGFAWEPGAFSIFICLALYCNLLRTRWRIRNNLPLYVLTFVLLTTQSTTGCLIFLLMFIYKLIADRNYVLLSIMVPAIVGFSCLPFMMPKFIEEFRDVSNFTYEDLSYGANQLGRLRSLYLAWQDFLEHPVFGLGGYAYGTKLYGMGFTEVSLISGIGELLSMYGSVMTTVFIVSLVLSSYNISFFYENRYSYSLIIVIIGMCISYSLWRNPLIMAFWMTYYFNNHSRYRKVIANKVVA